MNTQKKLELKVGIVSLLALIILIVGISLAKGLNVSVSKQTVKFIFDNSGGITEGSPVVVNGVRRGSVTSVKNIDNGVAITADINSIADLKEDANATITILEITGGKKIELNSGTSELPFNIKHSIPGKSTADISDLVAILGEVSDNAVSLVRNLDTLAYGLNLMMGDGKLAENVNTIVDNAIDITNNVNNLLENNYAMLERTIKDISSLIADFKKTYDKQEPKLDKLINDIDLAVSDARELLSTTKETMSKANSAIDDINHITNEVKSGNGLASRLIYDKNMAQQLDSTINSLNVLVGSINKHGVNVNVRLGTRP